MKWYDANKAKVADYAKRYHEENGFAPQKKWQKAHREQYNAYMRAYTQKKRDAAKFGP